MKCGDSLNNEYHHKKSRHETTEIQAIAVKIITKNHVITAKVIYCPPRCKKRRLRKII